ncbi:MAG: hypothetical protein QW791_09050 [Candidatus Bathyarchaeia archaeon]
MLSNDKLALKVADFGKAFKGNSPSNPSRLLEDLSRAGAYDLWKITVTTDYLIP